MRTVKRRAVVHEHLLAWLREQQDEEAGSDGSNGSGDTDERESSQNRRAA
ncbi:hypothetical protein [Sinomonas atrocyanea]